jgi:cell division protein FtsQ
MDGRGRLAQPLNGIARWRSRGAAATRPARAITDTDDAAMRTTSANTSSAKKAGFARMSRFAHLPRFVQAIDRWSSLLDARLPRGIGVAATALVLLASLAYGAVKGEHVSTVIAAVRDARDGVANAAGFRIVSIALAGNHHVSREELFAIAGVTGTTSLLFLDVDQARERLKSNPWIADATVLKLYPGELQIGIKEREPFALWQKDRQVSVIADDGTVLEPYVVPRLIQLPLVVGQGAETRAKAFLAMLGRYPAMRDFVRATVLVGERRWNLRLKNGIDVQLPESDIAAALEKLVTLDREKNLITRDIAVIDLRLADRVTVRLSDAAAQARTDALKDKSKKKGGNA